MNLFVKIKLFYAFTIAPETTMNVSRTESDTRKLTALYKHGYSEAMKAMPELLRYLEG